MTSLKCYMEAEELWLNRPGIAQSINSHKKIKKNKWDLKNCQMDME